jgi:hypothetical protein
MLVKALLRCTRIKARQAGRLNGWVLKAGCVSGVSIVLAGSSVGAIQVSIVVVELFPGHAFLNRFNLGS